MSAFQEATRAANKAEEAIRQQLLFVGLLGSVSTSEEVTYVMDTFEGFT